MTMTCVIYARYSSDNQREESIEGQLRECKEFAEKNDRFYVNSWGREKKQIIAIRVGVILKSSKPL